MRTVANLHMLTRTTDSLGILVSQIKKFSEQRISKVPRIEDLEWSGIIGQLASWICLTYWPIRSKAEYSGPEAAVKNAFSGRACVICEKEKSDPIAVEKVEHIYKTLGMHIIYMDAANHDIHAAYVSHISHITSFALANTVLEKEREEDAIFELAGGGFESTVRLAKSNSDMWVPIFMQNKENVLDVLNEHISQLRKFKSCLEKENFEYLKELIEQANGIKRILK
jgi:prephenate dehydrogenase